MLLTNGVEWQLYHLTFDNNGSHPDLVFRLDFLETLEKDPDLAWDTLSVLAKGNVQEDSLDNYYEQQKLLSPKMIVATLVGEEVLMKIRQELNRKAPARLELKKVFHAVVQVLNSEAVAAAGNINAPAKKRRRHRRSVGNGEQTESQISVPPSQTQPQTPAEEEMPT